MYSTKVNVVLWLRWTSTCSVSTAVEESEKTYKEHRRLYFHDGKWLLTKHAEVEEVSDSTPLSISLPPESVEDDSSDLSDAISIMDDGTPVSVCVINYFIIVPTD